ncbi:hypothetical protein [Aquirhabdus parva]|nr:hypothetical protein [Aquirhabdus parva]
MAVAFCGSYRARNSLATRLPQPTTISIMFLSGNFPAAVKC